MLKNTKIKNALVALLLFLFLSACGGGSGGGAVTAVTNFVEKDLSNLSGSSNIVSNFSNLLLNFNSTISNGNFGSLQAVITGPDENDKSMAHALLAQLSQAESLWSESEQLISDQSDSDKFRIYNSNSYKESYAAIIYLRDHVKPIIERVSQGKSITLEQLNLITKTEKASEIIAKEKNSSALIYAEDKMIKSIVSKNSVEVIYDQVENGISIEDTSNSSWETIEGQGGKEKRTVLINTPQIRVIRIKTCAWNETTKLSAEGNKVISSSPNCSTNETSEILSPKIESIVEFQEGSNPVISTEILEDLVSEPVIEWNLSYGNNGILTTTTIASNIANNPEIVAGSESTSVERYTKTKTIATSEKNQIWVVTEEWEKTKTTKPAVSISSNNVTYKDTKTKQKRTWTITTKQKKVTYKDGTSEILSDVQPKVYDDWTTIQTEEITRTVKEEKDRKNIFLTPDITDAFVKQTSKILKSSAYTEEDEDLGIKTTGISLIAGDFKSLEFLKDSSKSIINADKAYARGWTGKGAILGVIDSYQEITHESLNGKYQWYNNYVRYSDGKKDANGNEMGTVLNGGKNISHGTHVAGIIAGKKNDNLFHGVAFDSNLVGANIDYHGRGSAHMSYAWHALKDIAKLKSSRQQGGEEMNIVAINMSFNKASAYHHYGDITKLSDGTYSAPKITSIMQNSGGGAQYWRVGTDNDIVLVNSAGNGLYINGSMNYDFALDPGIWATETDNNDNLVLGGKMIIVGNWGGTKENGQVVSSKAGHVCLNIVNNSCEDKYQTKDFYILAPGNSIWSSVPGNEYAALGGSSMAAPQVTGALGILNQMWPHMKSANLVKLVLNTADRNIKGYDENIHGQGMLDLNQATRPQGAVGIPTTGRVDGASTSLNNTYFATGSTSAFSSLSNIKIMVIDEYDRDFYTELESELKVQDNRKYSDIGMLMINNNDFLPIQQMYGSFSQGGQYKLPKNMKLNFYTGVNGDADYSISINKNFLLGENVKLKTGIGNLNEKYTWLGNSSNGILEVGQDNRTSFGNVGVEYKLGSAVLILDYKKGYTNVNASKGSIIKNFSDIETESYRLAYKLNKDKSTIYGWSLSFPSHITSGKMDLEVAKSVNLDGTINFLNTERDLSQAVRERNFGFFYSHVRERDVDSNFNFNIEYRQNISGIYNNDDINLELNYTKEFNSACGFFVWNKPEC